MVFEDATAPSPWTVPSHVSLLTGLSPQSHGVTDRVQHMDPGADTMATWLERHGYDTAAVVNTVLLDSRRGFASGFDSFDLVVRPHREAAAPEVHRRALRWLERARQRPFFLFLHYYDVHSDYAPGKNYRELLVGPYQGAVNGTSSQLKDVRLGKRTLTPADVTHLSELYDAEVRQLDDELGRFLDALQERGLLDDTVIAVTSDHGEEFLEHGGVLHGRTLYGELVRVPLILAGPGIPAGSRVAGPVSLVDVFPTLMGLLGVAAPPYVEGVDLWRGSNGSLVAPGDRPIFFGTDWWLGGSKGEWKRAVQQGDWKLLYAHPARAFELYDLASDPGEQRNLADDDPERTEALRALLAPQLRPAARPALRVPVSEEETEQLRALGYLE